MQIIVIAFNKPTRLESLLQGLAALEDDCLDVSIFLDGPKTRFDEALCEQTRLVAESYKEAKGWSVNQSTENLGLRHATPNAIESVLARSRDEFFCVLEDDVTPTKQFLKALDHSRMYLESVGIGHVSLVELLHSKFRNVPDVWMTLIPDSHAWMSNRETWSLYKDSMTAAEVFSVGQTSAPLATKIRLIQLLLLVKFGLVTSWAFRFTLSLLRNQVPSRKILGGVDIGDVGNGSNTFLGDRLGMFKLRALRSFEPNRIEKKRFRANLAGLVLFPLEVLALVVRKVVK